MSTESLTTNLLDVLTSIVAHKIFARLNAEHAGALACVARQATAQYKVFLAKYPRFGGATRLYQRQTKALDWLADQRRAALAEAKEAKDTRDAAANERPITLRGATTFRNASHYSSAVFINAYPSFGKTLVALAWALEVTGPAPQRAVGPAWMHAGTLNATVVILVLPAIINVWEDELNKHLPGAVAAKRRIILVKKGTPESAPSRGQILVTANMHHVDDAYRVAELHFIVDEAHRIKRGEYRSHEIDLPDLNLNGTRFVMLTLLTANTSAETRLDAIAPPGVTIRGAFHAHQSKMLLDNIMFETILGEHVTNTAAELIVQLIADPKNIVIVLCNGAAPANICKKALGLGATPSLVHKASAQTRVKTLREFDKNGGALIGTMKSLAEGQNFNKANVLIVAATTATRSEMFQSVGRVCRDSNRNGAMRVIFVLPSGTGRAVHQVVRDLIDARGVEGERRATPSLGLSVTVNDAVFKALNITWASFTEKQRLFTSKGVDRSEYKNSALQKRVVEYEEQFGDDPSTSLVAALQGASDEEFCTMAFLLDMLNLMAH